MPLSEDSKMGLHMSSHSLVVLPWPSPQIISDRREHCWATFFIFAASRAARPDSWGTAPWISLEPLNAFVRWSWTASCSDRALWTSSKLYVLNDMRKTFSFQIGGLKCLHSFTPLRAALLTLLSKWHKKSSFTLENVKWHHFAERKIQLRLVCLSPNTCKPNMIYK